MLKNKTLMYTIVVACIFCNSILMANEIDELSKGIYAKGGISHFSSKDNLGGNFSLGKRSDAVGFEFGTQAENLYLDFNGYKPIYHNFELKIGAGLGAEQSNINKIHSRLGLGFNYNLTNKISLSHELNPIFKNGERTKIANSMGIAYSF